MSTDNEDHNASGHENSGIIPLTVDVAAEQQDGQPPTAALARSRKRCGNKNCERKSRGSVMTSVEKKEREEKKKEKNKEAARRTRQKKKQMEENLQQELIALRKHNYELTFKQQKLSKVLKDMNRVLAEAVHSPSCISCRPPVSQFWW